MSSNESPDNVDFLIIGAQKAATTWLTEILRQHPDIWMPMKKELHYFDAAKKYPSQNYLSLPPWKRIFLSKKTGASFHYHIKRFWWVSLKKLIKNPGTKSFRDISWAFRYLFCSASDEWYLHLFRDGGGKIRGEASPSYSVLTLADVERIKTLLPQVKIIYVMRNPVARAWSQVRFRWQRSGRTLDKIGTARIYDFIDAPSQALHNNYDRTLAIWNLCFPPEQIFIGFYDDIANDPKKFLRDVLTFLGTDLEKLPASVDLQRQVNVSRKDDMPDDVKTYLAIKYLPMIRSLASRFDGPPKKWLKETLAILEKSSR